MKFIRQKSAATSPGAFIRQVQNILIPIQMPTPCPNLSVILVQPTPQAPNGTIFENQAAVDPRLHAAPGISRAMTRLISESIPSSAKSVRSGESKRRL